MDGKLRYSNYTKYNKIFRYSYWGNFTKDRSDIIVINRDNFVEKYDIVKYCKKRPEYVEKYFSDPPYYSGLKQYFDHVEVYNDTQKNYIILVSPYDTSRDEYFLELGFNKVEPLYVTGATTYLKIVLKPTKIVRVIV